MASFDAKIDEFYKNFDTKVDKEKFNLLLVTEYVEQGWVMTYIGFMRWNFDVSDVEHPTDHSILLNEVIQNIEW